MAYVDTLQGFRQEGGFQQVPTMELNQQAAFGVMNTMQDNGSLAAGIYSFMMSPQDDDLQQVTGNKFISKISKSISVDICTNSGL